MICPMCGKPIEGNTSAILPGKDLCMVCAGNIQAFANGETVPERHAAFDYILNCRETTQDPVVLKAIDSLLRKYNAEEAPAESPVASHHSATEEAPNEPSASVRHHSPMFDNIGVKIMSVAEVFCWLGIAVSVILGLILVFTGFDTRNGDLLVIIGIAVALVGSVLSWLGSLLSYGFGELVNNSRIQAEQALKNASEK